MYIIRPTVLEDDRKVLVEELNTIVTSRGGAILEQNEWGMKDLAYEIQKHKSGYYYFLVANTTTEANKEFELRITIFLCHRVINTLKIQHIPFK